MSRRALFAPPPAPRPPRPVEPPGPPAGTVAAPSPPGPTSGSRARAGEAGRRGRLGWTVLSVLAAPLAALALAGCGGGGETPAPPAAPAAPSTRVAEPSAEYRAEVEEWRRRRLDNLTRDGGWLTVVGLEWLVPGTNPAGSGPDAAVHLPEPAPDRLGSFTVDGVTARFEAEVDALAIDAETPEPLAAGDRVEMVPDTAPGGPTVLAYGPLRFHVIERGGRLGVRIKDFEAEQRRGFDGLEHFPIDPSWRVEARFERHDPPKTIRIPNVLGTVEEEASAGAVVFERDGATYRLDAVAQPEDAELFLIFGDRTNGRDTYGGGRFLYAEAPPADDPEATVVVDFNRAYNPPCAFTAFATCPLPPPGNKLPIRVEAGEKAYAHAPEH